MAGAERRRSSAASAEDMSKMAQAPFISVLARSQMLFTRSFSSGEPHFRAAVSRGQPTV